MLTLEQAKVLAAKLSKEKQRTQYINRYFYHNPMTRERELRYTVDDTTRVTITVFTYIAGEQQ